MSGTLTLHDHPYSSNALKVRFLLAELGLSYERRHVRFQEPRPEWHTGVQPSGTIPLLIDGDLLIGESNAILRYLARREQRHDLYPADPAEAAAVDWALDLWSTRVRPAFLEYEDAALWDSGDPETGGRHQDGDRRRMAAALPAVTAALDVWERFLPGGSHTALGRLTIADCCVAPVLWRTRRLPIDLAGQPNCASLRAALESHPAFLAAKPRG